MKRICHCLLNDWKQVFEVAHLLQNERWAYRGHADSDWKLETSLERECFEEKFDTIDRDFYVPRRIKNSIPVNVVKAYARDICGGTEYFNELMAIKEFVSFCSNKFAYDHDDFVRWLAVMQHFGAKTRLLDFSYSIFVALYFAYCERAGKKNQAIWCVNLEAIDAFAQKELTRILGRPHNPSEEGYITIVNEVIGRQSIDSSIHGVLPLKLTGNNERINAQNGMFLFPVSRKPFVVDLAASLESGQAEIEDPSSVDFVALKSSIEEERVCLIKLELSHALRHESWKVLQQVNISARTLFPGLEGIARSIRIKLN